MFGMRLILGTRTVLSLVMKRRRLEQVLRFWAYYRVNMVNEMVIMTCLVRWFPCDKPYEELLTGPVMDRNRVGEQSKDPSLEWLARRVAEHGCFVPKNILAASLFFWCRFISWISCNLEVVLLATMSLQNIFSRQAHQISDQNTTASRGCVVGLKVLFSLGARRVSHPVQISLAFLCTSNANTGLINLPPKVKKVFETPQI